MSQMQGFTAQNDCGSGCKTDDYKLSVNLHGYPFALTISTGSLYVAATPSKTKLPEITNCYKGHH